MISGVLPREAAIQHIKESIRKTYGRKGETVVAKNFAAVDGTLARLYPGHGSRRRSAVTGSCLVDRARHCPRTSCGG